MNETLILNNRKVYKLNHSFISEMFPSDLFRSLDVFYFSEKNFGGFFKNE
jgi:hypothetical protein